MMLRYSLALPETATKRGSRLKSFLKGALIQLPTFIGRKKRSLFLKKVNDAISKIDTAANDAIFSYKGVDIKNVVFNKIRTDIAPTLCTMYAQSTYLNFFLKRQKPTMIISQMSRYINYNLGEFASLCDIPSVLISHGSHVPPKNEYEMIEWREHGLGLVNTCYEYIAVQSPWAKAYLEIIPTQGKQIITGPLLFANIGAHKKEVKALRTKVIPGHEDKIVLLHADTPRPRMYMRMNVYQTVDEYLSSINSLIRAVERMKNFYLILRFRPYVIESDIMPLLVKSDCYSIHAEGSFEDFLSLSDMLVSYSSTTIEEALQNKVPVLLYDKQGKYCHIEGQTLSPSQNPQVNSCYYVDREDNLQWALRWLSENHFGKTISDSLWRRHIFDKNETVALTDYFKGLFEHEKTKSKI